MDLSASYLGLALRNPLVASASPLSNTLDGVRRLAGAGVGAIVLYSLFEEQLRQEATRNARLADAGSESFAESLSYFPAAAAESGAAEEAGPRQYLSLLERAATAVEIPVIGSLNGVTPGGWTRYARAMQDAGAAAIELNIYYVPGDPRISGQEVEQRHIDILLRVRAAVTVPVAVKLSPYFSSTGEMALRLGEAGAPRCRSRWHSGLTKQERTASCCSTGSCNQTSTRRSWLLCPPWTCPARARPGWRVPGSRSSVTTSAPRSPPPPASTKQPTWSSTSWPAPTW